MKRFLVSPGRAVQLKKCDASDCGALTGQKALGEEQHKKLTRELEDLQYRLYAEHKQKVLSGGPEGRP